MRHLGTGSSTRCPHISTLLHDPQIFDAGVTQARPQQKAGEASTNDRHLHLVGHGFAFDRLDVRIIDVLAERPRHLHVLAIAVGSEPFQAFLFVLLPQGLGVERQLRIRFVLHRSLLLRSVPMSFSASWLVANIRR